MILCLQFSWNSYFVANVYEGIGSIKEPYNNQGYLGGLGVEPNNLIYTYSFEKNVWKLFTQLDSLFIENYSCTTYFSKDGQR